STIADKLSIILQLPVIHLDSLHFQPNWREAPDDEFRGQVQSFVRQNDSWIVDGQYQRVVGDIINASATCVLWLDPPFLLYFPRLVIRTFMRLVRWAPPCSPGCDERWSEVFSWGKQSIVWWSWTNHTPLQRVHAAAMQQSEDNLQGGKWVRLGGWGREVSTWLKQVESFAKAR
ncbi:hypothetical protein JB92DRAFT_2690507, partial [Gautieria morchelliformis]